MWLSCKKLDAVELVRILVRWWNLDFCCPKWSLQMDTFEIYWFARIGLHANQVVGRRRKRQLDCPCRVCILFSQKKKSEHIPHSDHWKMIASTEYSQSVDHHHHLAYFIFIRVVLLLPSWLLLFSRRHRARCPEWNKLQVSALCTSRSQAHTQNPRPRCIIIARLRLHRRRLLHRLGIARTCAAANIYTESIWMDTSSHMGSSTSLWWIQNKNKPHPAHWLVPLR